MSNFDDVSLPALVLPPLTIDLASCGHDDDVQDTEDRIVLIFDKSSGNNKDKDDQEQDGSGGSNMIDWRSHDKIRTLYAHKHDTLPILVAHFPVEERTGFTSDLLWRHLARTSRRSGASSPNSPAAGGGSKNSSPQQQQQQSQFSYYQQAKAAKQQQQAGQASKKGQVRGELGSAAQGQERINITAEEYTVDWYAVLKVDEAANESQIKSAFRRRCLDTHPDKNNGSDVEFKKVQRAFEILGTPDARLQYDSSREFDDSIPPDEIDFDGAPAEFFGMYAPVFGRNARWSTLPVNVSLGDMNTPLAEVNKFYDFWLSFRSWRDFAHAAEDELEEIHDSMCREEKRYYQRENERILAGFKKAEVKRIRDLVDRAMAADPRLRAEARRQEAERDAQKRARSDALAAAKSKREQEEREAVEREAAAKREAKEAEVRARQALKDAKASVIAALTAKGLIDAEETSSMALVADGVRVANVEWLFTKLQPGKDPQQLAQKILGADGVDNKTLVEEFNKLVQAIERSGGMTRYGEPIAAAASPGGKKAGGAAAASSGPAAASVKADWSDEDVVQLMKAIAKFPPGTVDRWRRIAGALRDKFTEEQVLAKTRELEQSKDLAKRAGTNLTAFKETAGVGTGDGGVGEVGPMKPSQFSGSNTAPPGAAAVVATTGLVAEVDEWTVKQQQQLEEGLRALKEYKEKDKFIKVAEYVTGKTARQCFERFQHLRTLSSGGKAAPAAAPKKAAK